MKMPDHHTAYTPGKRRTSFGLVERLNTVFHNKTAFSYHSLSKVLAHVVRLTRRIGTEVCECCVQCSWCSTSVIRYLLDTIASIIRVFKKNCIFGKRTFGRGTHIPYWSPFLKELFDQFDCDIIEEDFVSIVNLSSFPFRHLFAQNFKLYVSRKNLLWNCID